MNKLLFHEGGQPFGLNDIAFLQESIEQSFRHLASILPEGYYGEVRLPRHSFSETDISWTSGLVVIGGRASYLKAGSMPYSAEHTYYIHIDEQAELEQTFQDGGHHFTRQVELAVVTNSEPTQPHIKLFSSARLPGIVNIGSVTITSPFKHTDPSFLGKPSERIGGIIYAEIPSMGIRVVSGVFNVGVDASGSDSKAVGIYASEHEDAYMKRLEGGCFITGGEHSIGTSLHLKDGKIYLLDARGEYVTKFSSNFSSPTRFTYILNLRNVY